MGTNSSQNGPEGKAPAKPIAKPEPTPPKVTVRPTDTQQFSNDDKPKERYELRPDKE